MKFKIISDSCCDLPEKKLKNIDIVPMTLIFDNEHFKDGEELSKEEFYHKLKNTKKSPGSAAPSAGDYMKAMTEGENVFVITVSSALSSSYNNAMLAKKLYLEKFNNKMIYIFDSLNASIGQGLAILKLDELLEKKLPIDKLVNHMEKYISEVSTFFILENLNNLINSGRINRILGKIVSALNVKLIMGKTPDGKIELYDKVRGSNRAFKKLLKIIGKNSSNLEEKILGIAHYNSLNKAIEFKNEVEKMYPFKDIIITQMGPTIATYADEGALLISF